MTPDIKSKFGKLFRTARDAKKISRASLGVRLGVSPKTIQSWEMGRTFIENLSLIPNIEAELGISVWDLAAQATSSKRPSIAAEAASQYGTTAQSRVFAGPTPALFEVHAAKIGEIPESETLGRAFVAVPLIRPQAVPQDVSTLTAKDIRHQIVVPAEWIPRGGVMIAYRMGDSTMVPMIPLGGTVILDRRPMSAVKALNRVVALDLHGKGVRVRRLQEDSLTGELVGAGCLEGQRGAMPFREDLGDRVIGRVVGILAEPS